uniref:Uncharacterized protein n=1 Tax=Aegilops tauschii subsp. strangulata TaxID=200361 RepID=A0A453B0A3_AEGTS
MFSWLGYRAANYRCCPTSNKWTTITPWNLSIQPNSIQSACNHQRTIRSDKEHVYGAECMIQGKVPLCVRSEMQCTQKTTSKFSSK